MCAINGFNWKESAVLERMNRVTAHRGPDGTGVWESERISLGHNRLSILDLSTAAAQPMWDERREVVIVFNGEIYNFKELRSQLTHDYHFVTTGDTEVILAAYKKWGRACVEKFEGIFAFAIWDTRANELLLARDPLGVKPLYYFWDGKRCIFSSEIKAILEHPLPRTIDMASLNEYMRLLYVPGPHTMFAGISALPAAHTALLRGQTLELQRYWQPPRGEYTAASRTQIAAELRGKVMRSVQDQLVSDRPLGLYLSGGIDSSVVLASMFALRGSDIDTFSVGFEGLPEGDMEKFNHDFTLARRTAAHFGTNHHEVTLAPDEVPELLGKAVYHMDSPIANATALAMMKLAGFAKQHVDVVLAGDGGDELFGGYQRYSLSRAATLYARLPTPVRTVLDLHHRLHTLNTKAGIDRFLLFMCQKEVDVARVLAPHCNASTTLKDHMQPYFSKNQYRTFEEQFMDVDRQTWLVDFALMLGDKMSMSGSIEERLPLLHKPLVEFAARIPLKYKVTPFATKKILKDAFRADLPPHLFKEPKRGWFSPGAKWLRHPLMHNYVREVLRKEYASATKDLFDWKHVEQMLKAHTRGEQYNLNLLWAILTLQLWAKTFDVKE